MRSDIEILNKRITVATVFAVFHLEAAHFLAAVPADHKCRRVHGHTYEVRVEVEGQVDRNLGWVIDYAAIEAAWNERVHARLDHQNLNEVLPELQGNTTSELLADWILGMMAHGLDLPRNALAVEVWETATCGAKVYG